MIEKKERIVWLAALLTLLGVLGFNYYKTHEHDEALALIAYPPTAYDTPIIPEMAEEKERRILGMEKIKTAPKVNPEELIIEMFGVPGQDHIEHYQDGFDRVQNYLSAEFLLAHPTSWAARATKTEKPSIIFYLSVAMREGYAPAHNLYQEHAALDLKHGLKFFREEKYDEGWQLILPLAAEGYPPAVKKVASISNFFGPRGDCISAYWFIPNAKKGDPYAMGRVIDMLKITGMRRNSLLAYAWHVKKNQLTGQDNPMPYMFDAPSEREAQIIKQYALATPVEELPLGIPMLAPLTPLKMNVTSTVRLARGGLFCIEGTILYRPPGGPPVDDPENPYDDSYYQIWLDTIKDPQD